MAKSNKEKVKYLCTECGYDTLKWMGKCPSCNSWGTMKEFKESSNKIKKSISEISNAASKGISSINRGLENIPSKMSEIEFSATERIDTGIEEFNRVLGGGVVNGMVILIGGDPGIGKSTLMLQLAGNLTNPKMKEPKSVLYVTGEESLSQIKMRANRLNYGENERFKVFAETDMNMVKDFIIQEDNEDGSSNKPDVIIIDSIQTVFLPEVESAPGTVTQLREVTSLLVLLAKKLNIPIFLVGHVTKEGSIAGPRIIEHMVDTVLYFEGDRYHFYRILRTVKNRFGSTNEIGIFEMKNTGLMEVKNPSEYFLNSETSFQSGSSITASIEGSRPFLVEVQALVTSSNFGNPQRNFVGYDGKRLNKILAVMEKRNGIFFGNMDVFLNITGGGKLTDPAADLAVCISLYSSVKNITLSQKSVFVGEIGLGGEVRNVSNLEFRLKEAEKLGYEKIYINKNSKSYDRKKFKKIRIIEIETVDQLFEEIDFG